MHCSGAESIPVSVRKVGTSFFSGGFQVQRLPALFDEEDDQIGDAANHIDIFLREMSSRKMVWTRCAHSRNQWVLNKGLEVVDRG